MKDIIEKIESLRDINDLSCALGELFRNVQELRSRGPEGADGLVEAAFCVDRMEVVLKDLEAAEVRSWGANRSMADRFLEIESALRSLAAYVRGGGAGPLRMQPRR